MKHLPALASQNAVSILATTDAASIRQLAHKIWPSTFQDILRPAQIDYMLTMMYEVDVLLQQMKEGVCFLLVRIHDENVGFCGYQKHYPTPKQCKIHKLYILPQYQGYGLGAALIQKVIDAATDMECLALNVNRFNNAVGFYKKLGFSIVREENIDIGEGYWMEDYVMEKAIQQ